MLSIATVSRTFATASAGMSSTEPAAPVHNAPRAGREQGSRHELVDALNRTLGMSGDATRAQTQSVFRFAHALMQDLRAMDGSAAPAGDGTAPVATPARHEWNDLPQRLNALAAAASRPAAPAAAADDAGSRIDPSAPAPALPEAPKPMTPATAAVYIMKVPSSQLLQAFVAVQRALGQQDQASDADARSSLAALARQLAGALSPDAKAGLPAGTVVNLTA
jgi:hypothetical protein